jgi:hypothetical protein
MVASRMVGGAERIYTPSTGVKVGGTASLSNKRVKDGMAKQQTHAATRVVKASSTLRLHTGMVTATQHRG